MKLYPRDPVDAEALWQNEENERDYRRQSVVKAQHQGQQIEEATQGDSDGLYLEDSTIEDNNDGSLREILQK